MSESKRYPLGPILMLGASLISVAVIVCSITLLLVAAMIGAI